MVLYPKVDFTANLIGTMNGILGEPVYLVGENGLRTPVLNSPKTSIKEILTALNEYKWKSEDFLLATYPKNGTHLAWEIMMMLLKGNAEYQNEAKAATMIDIEPVTKVDDVVPSPRVLNTHYLPAVLPKEFQGRRTVVVLRNPKDACVSYFHHRINLEIKLMSAMLPEEKRPKTFPFSEFVPFFLNEKHQVYGNYFDYVDYVWSMREDPNVLIVFYGDLVRDPIKTIQKIDKFMGTNRSTECIEKIADKTTFSKMKAGKKEGEEEMIKKVIGEKLENLALTNGVDPSLLTVYRKGKIGDWKDHLTVAENEIFDAHMKEWQKGKDIPFTYV